MATMLPRLTADEFDRLAPSGEAKVYRWLATLPAEYHVFHSAKWAERTPGGIMLDREADFVICDPHRGLLVVEVKGGGVSIEGGRWFTANRYGEHIGIQDPFEQAKKNLYSLVDLFRSLPIATNVPRVARAVFFPDVAKPNGYLGAANPIQIVGTELNFGAKPEVWIKAVFEYQAEGATKPAVTSVILQRLTEAVAPSVEIERSVRDELGELEIARVRLTRQQALIVRSYRTQKRLTVRGAAGTGKTLIALDFVKKLGLEGKRTAYLCYNRELAKLAASELLTIPNAGAFTFHGFCKLIVDRAKANSGVDILRIVESRTTGEDMYDVVLPEALLEAVDHIEDRYDAIIVDEAQDFKPSYWLGVESMLASRDSVFWVFGDENQIVYDQGFLSQVSAQVCSLDTNCRNGSAIHALAYRFYKGDPVEAFDLPGQVTWLPAESLAQGSALIAKEVRALLDRGVSPREMTVLIAGEPKVDYIDEIMKQKLGRGVGWRSSEDQVGETSLNEVVVDTVRRFKGLENAVVFVWGAEDAVVQQRKEYLYVGFSRATSRLFVVGDRDRIQNFGDQLQSSHE